MCTIAANHILGTNGVICFPTLGDAVHSVISFRVIMSVEAIMYGPIALGSHGGEELRVLNLLQTYCDWIGVLFSGESNITCEFGRNHIALYFNCWIVPNGLLEESLNTLL